MHVIAPVWACTYDELYEVTVDVLEVRDELDAVVVLVGFVGGAHEGRASSPRLLFRRSLAPTRMQHIMAWFVTTLISLNGNHCKNRNFKNVTSECKKSMPIDRDVRSIPPSSLFLLLVIKRRISASRGRTQLHRGLCK